MRRYGKVTLIMVLTVHAAFGGHSKILGAIKDFLPNATEIGWITNIINVYFQMSQFVRSTNEIVRNMKSVKTDIENARREIVQVYNICSKLKEISLYDMDTWSHTVNYLNYLVTRELDDMVHAFAMLEYHTVDASVNYMDDIHDIREFDIRKKKTTETVEKYFLDENYRDELKAFNTGRKEYYRITLATLQNLYLQKQIEYTQTGNEELKEELDGLRLKIRVIENKLNKADITIEKMKIDSIIEEAKDLIAINLVEIQAMERQVVKMEEAASVLIDAYNSLKENRVGTKGREGNIITEIGVKDDNYGDHPNQVKVPESPKDMPHDITRKKDVNAHDILSLQNGINYLLLKQESLLRDIGAMKCNTMAFILCLEAYTQDTEEIRGVVMATHAHSVMQNMEGMR